MLPSMIPVTVQVAGAWPDLQRASDSNQISGASTYRPSDPKNGNAATNTTKNYDLRKWQVLKEVDEEIAGAASRIAALGSRLEDEMAEKYLTLNDKAYLATLERQLTERSNLERQKAEALVASMGTADAESCQKEMENYNESLRRNSQMDQHENIKVVKVEPYNGRWMPAQGGIKVTLENGAVILKKGGFHRLFKTDSETS